MNNIEYLDRPLAGDWFPLDVMPENDQSRSWVALMVDVVPDDLKHCYCKTAFLYVDPNEYRPLEGRTAREIWLRVPGKHRNKRAAWRAVQDFMATRH
jgi:hypothetical protein